MCHYITAMLPVRADAQAVRRLFGAHKRALEPLRNDTVTAQLPPGEQYFATTRGMCDCLTALGARRAARRAAEAPTSGQVERLRRKGWREWRIARWQAEKGRAIVKQEKAQQAEEATYLPDAEAWAGLLRDVVASGLTSRVGVLLHWYRSSPAQERIVLSRNERVAEANISAELLLAMEEDVLYSFER